MSCNYCSQFSPTSIYYHLMPPQAQNLNCKNKKVLITGGNSGIGEATVLELVKNGCTDITIVARDAKSANKVIEKCFKQTDSKGNFVFVKMDLTKLDNVKETAKELAMQKFDVILCNAGVMSPPDMRIIDGIESFLICL